MSMALNDIPASSQAAVGYFVDQKKGEVNELKQVSSTNLMHKLSSLSSPSNVAFKIIQC
jgi:hypothetical protein